MATDSVTNVSGTSALDIESKKPVKDKEMGQDVFLQLMIAQLKNQDPTSPTDSQDFLQQLASFNTVTGITGLQKSVDTLASSLQSSQALQASTLVGRTVLMSSDALKLSEGKAPAAVVDLKESAGSLQLKVQNSKGETVRNVDLGQQKAELVSFQWDGRDANGRRLPDGDYKLVAEAINGSEKAEQEVALKARVNSVTLPRDGSGPVLNLAGLGAMSLDNLKQML